MCLPVNLEFLHIFGVLYYQRTSAGFLTPSLGSTSVDPTVSNIISRPVFLTGSFRFRTGLSLSSLLDSILAKDDLNVVTFLLFSWDLLFCLGLSLDPFVCHSFPCHHSGTACTLLPLSEWLPLNAGLSFVSRHTYIPTGVVWFGGTATAVY